MNSIIFKNKIILVSSALSFLFLAVGLILVYFNITKLTSPLVLHFDGVLGIDFFGEKQALWFVWLTGLLIVVVNFFLAKSLFYRERVVSYLIFGATSIFTLLHFVAIYQIISLN